MSVYRVMVYESKSGRRYAFLVIAQAKKHAMNLVEEYSKEAIGLTCKVKSVHKFSDKPQVLDFYGG